MGYTTSFFGYFKIDKELDEETYRLINGLAKTRRMKRDIEYLVTNGYGTKEELGIDGEFFFVEETTTLGQEDVRESVIDHNNPPSTQPGLWLQWIVKPDKKTIVWDGVEKFYEADSWIEYIIGKILKPRGYKINGLVAAKGESDDDKWFININDNEVEVISTWDPIKFENGETEVDKYFVKINSDCAIFEQKPFFGEGEVEYHINYITEDDISEEDEYVSTQLLTFDDKKSAVEFMKGHRIKMLLNSKIQFKEYNIEKVTDTFVILDENTKVIFGSSENKMPILEEGVYSKDLYLLK